MLSKNLTKTRFYTHRLPVSNPFRGFLVSHYLGRMPKISSNTRNPAEPLSAELYGTTDQTEEEEITDIIQIGVSNTIFLSIAGLLFVCAIFLVRQLGFLPVMNGLFLCGSAIAISMLELYQPISVMAFLPFWNSCLSRGMILTWLSIIAMNGFWIIGFVSLALSIAVVISHFILGAPRLKPVFYDEVTLKPIFDTAPSLKPLFYTDLKNSGDREENKEETIIKI
jgi:hypothetical protein